MSQPPSGVWAEIGLRITIRAWSVVPSLLRTQGDRLWDSRNSLTECILSVAMRIQRGSFKRIGSMKAGSIKGRDGVTAWIGADGIESSES